MQTDPQNFKFSTASEKQSTPIAESGPPERRTEPKNKLKKLRSIKLSKLPSLRASARRSNSGFGATDSIQLRKENSQASLNDSESSFDLNRKNLNCSQPNTALYGNKSVPNLMKISGLRSRGHLMKKCMLQQGRSGSEEISDTADQLRTTRRSPSQNQDGRRTRTEPKKKLKKLRSIKMSVTGNVRRDAGPNSFESIKEHPNRDAGAKILRPKKSVRPLTRKSSLKPLRNAPGGLKPKKSAAVEKCSEVDRFRDLSIDRATCSSTLKDSKFPDFVVRRQGGAELAEFCPYNYCCLSGHRHSHLPPLSRSLSKKRRSLKNQKSLKLKGLSPMRTKYYQGKEIHNSQMHPNEDLAKQGSAHVETGKENCKAPCPEISFNKMATSPSAKEGVQVKVPDGTSPECIRTNMDASASESTETYRNDGSVKEVMQRGYKEIKSGAKVSSDQQNNNRMWHRLLQQVVSHTTVEVDIQPVLDGNDEERADNAGPGQDLCDKDENMGIKSHYGGCQNVELNKIEAVKLVQEAVDEIFPPEIEDQSSEEQAVTTDRVLDQGLSEDHNRESGKADNAGSQQQLPKSWSNMKKLILLRRFIKRWQKVMKLSFRGPLHMPLEARTEAEKVYLRHQTADERRTAEEWLLDYALQQVVAKLTPARKRKVELLVEAFETVIPLPEAEAEADPRSNATASNTNKEVKMSQTSFNGGHAIGETANNGKVVSSAIQEAGKGTVAEGDAEPKIKSNGNGEGDEAIEGLADGNRTGGKGHNGEPAKILSGKTSCPEVSLDENFDHIQDISVAEQHIMVKSPEHAETSLEPNSIINKLDKSVSERTVRNWKGKELDNSIELGLDDENILSRQSDSSNSCKPVLVNCNGYGEVLMGGQEQQEDCRENYSKPISGLCKGTTELNGAVLEADKLTCEARDLRESISSGGTVSRGPICKSSEELAVTRKGNSKCGETDIGLLKVDPLPSRSVSSGTSNAVNQIMSDKQTSIRMWRLLYQNAVEFIAKEGGTQPPVDGVDKENQIDGVNELHGTVPGSGQKFIEEEGMGIDNHDAGWQDGEVNQTDVIKMVKEALDAIIPPEIPEHLSSEVQSIASDTNIGHSLSEENQGKGAEQSNSTSEKIAEGSFKGNFREYDKTNDESSTLPKADNATTPGEEKAVRNLGDQPDQKLPRKSWNKLKRIILLRRFIKQMDKVRKFNPQQQKNLPVEPSSEAEKVFLRHQIVDERRNAEEWMLDYALQQVVTQLTPARKRRVALLVEAFETVSPLS